MPAPLCFVPHRVMAVTYWIYNPPPLGYRRRRERRVFTNSGTLFQERNVSPQQDRLLAVGEMHHALSDILSCVGFLERPTGIALTDFDCTPSGIHDWADYTPEGIPLEALCTLCVACAWRSKLTTSTHLEHSLVFLLKMQPLVTRGVQLRYTVQYMESGFGGATQGG